MGASTKFELAAGLVTVGLVDRWPKIRGFLREYIEDYRCLIRLVDGPTVAYEPTINPAETVNGPSATVPDKSLSDEYVPGLPYNEQPWYRDFEFRTDNGEHHQNAQELQETLAAEIGGWLIDRSP